MNGSRFAPRSHVLIKQDTLTEDIALIDSHRGTRCASNTAAAFLVLQLEDGATNEALAVARRDRGRFFESLGDQGFLELREIARPHTAAARHGRASKGLAKLPA